jgi:hypothetical protein
MHLTKWFRTFQGLVLKLWLVLISVELDLLDLWLVNLLWCNVFSMEMRLRFVCLNTDGRILRCHFAFPPVHLISREEDRKNCTES